MNPAQSRPHTLRRAIAVFLSMLAIGLGCAFGASVPLAWSPVVDASGYALGWGLAPNWETNWTDVGNVTNATLKVPPGRVFIACCAYNSFGSGPRSNEQFFPGDLVLTVSGTEMVCSTDLRSWIFTNSPWTATNATGKQFFKCSDGKGPILTQTKIYGNQ